MFSNAPGISSITHLSLRQITSVVCRYRNCQPQPTASKPAPAKEVASSTLAWPTEKTENREASSGAETPTSQGWRSRGHARKPRQHWGERAKKNQPRTVGFLNSGGSYEYESASVACRKPSASPELKPFPEPCDQRQQACDLGLHPRRDARSPLAVGWETGPRAPVCRPCFPRSGAG